MEARGFADELDELALEPLWQGCRKTREGVYRRDAGPAWNLALQPGLVQGPGTTPGNGTDVRDWWALMNALETRLETLQVRRRNGCRCPGPSLAPGAPAGPGGCPPGGQPRDPALWSERVQLLDELNYADAGRTASRRHRNVRTDPRP